MRYIPDKMLPEESLSCIRSFLGYRLVL